MRKGFGISLLRVNIIFRLSWWIAALVVTLLLGVHFYDSCPEAERPSLWLAASLTTFVFFAAVVVHEFSHVFVAKARHLGVRSIILSCFGGVTHVESEPEDAPTEFWLGISGPMISAAIGLACQLLLWALSSSITPAAHPLLFASLVWIGLMNFQLALFNLIPVLPLDGGRVLHAVLWRMIGDRQRALSVTLLFAAPIAVGFLAFAFLSLMVGSATTFLWAAAVGFGLLTFTRRQEQLRPQ